MAPLTSSQLANRRRVEAVIRLFEPGLNMVLSVGDRISRVVERNDDWEPPVRPSAPAPPPADPRPAPANRAPGDS